MAHLHEVFFFFIRVIAMYASSPAITAKPSLQVSKHAFLRDSCQKKEIFSQGYMATRKSRHLQVLMFLLFIYL